MKDSVLLSFLYDTVPGRILLRPLIGKRVSVLAGRLLSTGASALVIPYFIRKHKISMKGIAVPEKGFSSFNDFFTRKIKPGRRFITNDDKIIREYSRNYDAVKKQIKQVKRQRNVAFGGGLFATLSLVIALIIK